MNDLPEPDFVDCDGRWYSEAKLHAYGLACRRAGMELAARICDAREGRGDPYDATYDVAVGECATAIRKEL
jgi:hypothetical protein